MPEIGDIVTLTRAHLDYANGLLLAGEVLPSWMFTELILSGATTATDDQGIAHTVHPDNLCLVSGLNSRYAKHVHEAYVPHYGRDWHWYLYHRGLTSFDGSETPAAALNEETVDSEPVPMPISEWQVGDLVMRTVPWASAEMGEYLGPFSITHLYGSENGDEIGIFSPETIMRVGRMFCNNNFTWLSRPEVAAPQASEPVAEAPISIPAADWQVGDIVQRSLAWSFSTGILSADTLAMISELLPAGHVNLINIATGQQIGNSGGWSRGFFTFVRRPGIARVAVVAPVSMEQELWQVGDLVSRAAGWELLMPDGVLGRITQLTEYTARVENAVTGVQCTGTWSLSRLTWHSRPVVPVAAPVAATPLPFEQWQVGDLVSRDGWGLSAPHGVIGRILRFNLRILYLADAATGEPLGPGGWMAANLTWVSRPAPAAPPREYGVFMVGDLVRVVNVDGEASENSGYMPGPWNGRLGRVLRTPYITCDTIQISVEGYNNERWNTHNLELVDPAEPILVSQPSAPAVPAAPTTVRPTHRDVGRRVLISRPGLVYDGRIGSILSGGSNSRLYIKADGFSQMTVPVDCLSFAVQEPDLPAMSNATVRTMQLRLDDVSQELLDDLVATLVTKGYSDSRTNQHEYVNSSGDYRKHTDDGQRIWLRIRNKLIEYCTYQDYVQTGMLLRDWNKMVANTTAFNAEDVTPSKYPHLRRLPMCFIVENESTDDKDDKAVRNQQFFQSHGFTGFCGTYTLVQNNQVVGTELKVVAEAFQKLHNCLWFTKQDSEVLRSLFNKYRDMRTSSSASQKFAVDLALSGPHLFTAYKAFLSAIGYRQVNEQVSKGSYLLINGGGIHPNQPATWQYADLKNNRGLCLDLSAGPATPGAEGMSGKSGWQKATERLGNKGVALPILDPENLDRDPAIGDEVILVDNAYNSSYPETEVDLRTLVQGTSYKVNALSGDLLLLNNGLLVHQDRLAVLTKPMSIQNNDLVIITQGLNTLKVGDVFTYMNGLLQDEIGAAYAVGVQSYELLSGPALVGHLLKRLNLTLPTTAKVMTPNIPSSGQDVIITTAWVLNNQELAFWTENDEAKDSWYEAKDLAFHHSVSTEAATITLVRGSSRETTTVRISGVDYPLSQLEAALAIY